MPLANPLGRLLPSMESQGNLIRDAWDRMQGLPGGKAMFSRFIGTMAPYTGSIDPHVEEVTRGRSRVSMRDRRTVRNHLRSVHAIALVNLAELTGNLALLYSLGDDARMIIAGISMEYLKKARGTITAIGESPIPPSNERKEYEVKVELRDESGDLVARATLRSLVGPKRA